MHVTLGMFFPLISALLEIANVPGELSDGCTKATERFVELMYDQGSELSTLVVSIGSLQPLLPLNNIFFVQRTRREQVWSQVHLTLLELPIPTDWVGREMMDGDQCGKLCHKFRNVVTN